MREKKFSANNNNTDDNNNNNRAWNRPEKIYFVQNVKNFARLSRPSCVFRNLQLAFTLNVYQGTSTYVTVAINCKFLVYRDNFFVKLSGLSYHRMCFSTLFSVILYTPIRARSYLPTYVSRSKNRMRVYE